MGCCIALAVVIAFVRRGWFALFPSRRPLDVQFAPPAWRPAPGSYAGPIPAAPVAPLRRRRMSASTMAAATLVVAGVGWFVFGLVDMRFGLHGSACACACCSTASDSLLRHVVLHGSALLTVALGAVVFATRRTTERAATTS